MLYTLTMPCETQVKGSSLNSIKIIFMKKIFTLLFCTAIITSAFAQDDRGDWNRPDHDEYRGRHNYDRSYYDNNFFVYQHNRYGFNQRDEVIERISASYDYQIREVINDWSLNPWQKRHEIRELQEQKNREINNIYAQCNNAYSYPDRYRGHEHHDDDDD